MFGKLHKDERYKYGIEITKLIQTKLIRNSRSFLEINQEIVFLDIIIGRAIFL